jgi:hypothetical protein
VQCLSQWLQYTSPLGAVSRYWPQRQVVSRDVMVPPVVDVLSNMPSIHSEVPRCNTWGPLLCTTTAAAVYSLHGQPPRLPPVDELRGVGMTNTVLTDAFEDTSIVPPDQGPVFRVMV